MSAGGVRRRPLRPIGKLLAEDTKRHHRALILQHLFSGGLASRADLARATGLTRVTVSDLVGGLIDEGLLGEHGAPAETRVGKPPPLVGLLPAAFSHGIGSQVQKPLALVVVVITALIGVVVRSSPRAAVSAANHSRSTASSSVQAKRR